MGAGVGNAGNRLIGSLSRRDGLTLLSACKLVELVPADALLDPGTPTRYAYFPTGGCISLVARVEGSPGVAVGMVGAEGMLGAHLALGVSMSPLHASVQGPGEAWRLGARALQRELRGNAALRRTLCRYNHALASQLVHSAACLRFHLVGPRLVRWLLMSHDRSRSRGFRATHESLARLLGVRRVGVTKAAGILRRAGLIEYRRGEIAVLDRGGLEAAACGCYAADRRAYSACMS